MVRHFTFFVMILATWLLWSGHLDFLPVLFGVISSVFVLFLTRTMKLIDEESWPIELMHKLPTYWLWLVWQIMKSNLDVARRILTPSLPISPRMIELELPLQSDLGRVIYGNSITLTPGTVTTEIGSKTIEVHSLTSESEQELRSGKMAQRIRALESTQR